MIYKQEILDDMVVSADEYGMQVAIHAIGDAAIDSSLQSLEKAQANNPNSQGRHRIVHYEIFNKDLMRRTKDMGVIADIQPIFNKTDGAWLESRLGDRVQMATAWRTLSDYGILCIGGSDCPVEHFDPLANIHQAVTRRVNGDGEAFLPSECVNIEEALRMFTTNCAYGNFAENDRGRIAPGMLADLVVLNEDITTIHPDQIPNIDVMMTMVNGQVMYEK